MIKNSLNKMLEEACKDTPVSSKKLLCELIQNGYSKEDFLDLSKEDLHAIVSDLVESKEISIKYSHSSDSKVESDLED